MEAEREKAFKETLQKIFLSSLERRKKELSPTDMAGLQKLIAEQKRVREIAAASFSFQAC